MDRNGLIREHTKIKLDIYKKYITAYLPIILSVNFFEYIVIVEPCAGVGITDDGEEGSAVISKKSIIANSDTAKRLGKKMRLLLNDFIKESFDKLKKNTQPENFDFISIYQKDANEFLEMVTSDIQLIKNNGKAVHALYFLDPYGYTEINVDTYDSHIFSGVGKDILIFIPISHIYRAKGGNDSRTIPKKLLNLFDYLQITLEDVKAAKSIQKLADLINTAIKHKAQTPYVYNKIIQNKEANNASHALFFLTKNILGANKFLEAIDKVEEDNRKQRLFNFYDFIEYDKEKILVNILSESKEVTNVILYEKGIEAGLLPKHVLKVLKDLEKRNKVIVQAISPYERKRKGFYINHEDFKNRTHIIKVIWNGK